MHLEQFPVLRSRYLLCRRDKLFDRLRTLRRMAPRQRP